jgi:hypothetical protein
MLRSPACVDPGISGWWDRALHPLAGGHRAARAAAACLFGFIDSAGALAVSEPWGVEELTAAFDCRTDRFPNPQAARAYS